MGFDCSYQGIPENSALIHKALEDATFAEDVFYSLIAFASNLESKHYFKDNDFSEVRELFRIHPEIKAWNFCPTSRMQDALIYCLNPQAFENSTDHKELQKTFSYKFVKGQNVFCEHLRGTQGVRVRVSTARFIADCIEF